MSDIDTGKMRKWSADRTIVASNAMEAKIAALCDALDAARARIKELERKAAVNAVIVGHQDAALNRATGALMLVAGSQSDPHAGALAAFALDFIKQRRADARDASTRAEAEAAK